MLKRRHSLLCILKFSIIIIFIYGTWEFLVLKPSVDLKSDEFLQLSKCPACYGTDICQAIESGALKLDTWSQTKFFNIFNAKNVYYGTYKGLPVVLKKLAHDWELESLDKTICKLAGAESNCNASAEILTVAKLWTTLYTDQSITGFDKRLRVNAENIRHNSQNQKCMSDRLMEIIQANEKSKGITGVANLLTKLLINQESTLLLTFPSNIWPFPKYYGTCGRVLVEEFIGDTLDKFGTKNWLTRLDLAYQLLQMAEMFTNNKMDISLYLTDVSFHNFAVRSDGKLILVDVEDIILVDKRDVAKRKPSGWNMPYAHLIDGCPDCLSYSIDDLCNHKISDHNYYAVCKSLLSSEPYYEGIKGGLLHSIPTDVEERWSLSKLVEECASSKTVDGRWKAVKQLLNLMPIELSGKP